MLVYKATNTANGKVYVGKTVRSLSHAKARHKNRAFKAWKHGCESKFYNAIRKYGWDAFEWETLYKGTDDIDIQEKEKLYILELDALTSGYNSTPGGDGGAGKTLSDKHKEKLSYAIAGEKNFCFGKFGPDHPAYGNVHSEATKEAISKAHKGRQKSEEHRQKLSAAKKRISRFTQEDYDKMVQLRSEGLTYKDIGVKFNTSGAVVFKILKREATSNMR